MATSPTTIGFAPAGSAIESLYSGIAEQVATGIAAGKTRFHLIYPYGADRVRTVAGIVLRTKVKTIVLTGNMARLSAWMNRKGPSPFLQEAALDIWPKSPVHQISANPFSCSPVLTLIYSHLTPGKSREQQQEAAQRFAVHAERQGYKLLIVDECTELTPEWHEYLVSFALNAGAAIVGFSAGHFAGNKPGWSEVFSQARVIRIPAVAAVLQGCLTPFRHFLYLQRFTNNEGAADETHALQPAEKIASALEILASDFSANSGGIKSLVLMDPDALTHVRSAGLLDAVSFIRRLKEQAVLSLVRPAIMTGAAIVIQTSRQLEFMAAVSRHAQMKGWDVRFQLRSNDEFTEVSATGKDWNSAIYIDLALAMLQEGLSNCVLCTRELISWGLFRAPFGAVIDLSSDPYTFYVNTRDDSSQAGAGESETIVHYWDVAAIEEGKTESADLNRILRKHAQTEFPADDGFIEIGMGEMPLSFLKADEPGRAAGYQRYNEDQLRLAADRKTMSRLWKRITISGKIAESIDTLPKPGFPEQPVLERVLRDSLRADAQRFAQQNQSLRLHHTLWTVACISLALSAFLVFPMKTGMFSAAGVFLFLGIKIGARWWSVRGATPVMTTTSRIEFFRRLAAVVYQSLSRVLEETLPEPEQSITVTQKSDGTCRVIAKFENPDTEALFTSTLKEILTGFDTSSYHLICDRLDIEKKYLRTIIEINDIEALYVHEYHIPVPDFFSQSKAHAEVFRSLWDEYLGKARLSVEGLESSSLPAFASLYPAVVSSTRCVV